MAEAKGHASAAAAPGTPPAPALRTESRGFSSGRLARIALCAALSAALLAFDSASVHASGRPVSLTASDGTSLAGMLYEASSRPASAVLLVHMLGRSKDEWSQTAERLQDAGVTALAIDLRGHGQSGGYGSELPAMVGDVRSASRWLAGRPGVRASAMAIAGTSLGANLAALAAADDPSLIALALISPSLDYRGLRLDPSLIKKLAARPMWLAASTDDPYALRTIRELAADGVGREQRLSSVRGHGSALLAADQDLARALVDWLKARLIF